MQIKYIDSFDNTRISYAFKDGKKPPLLFIHGAGSNYTIWEPYLDSFKDHKLVAVNLRGHSLSDKGKISIKNTAKDIAHIIERENLDNFFIVGNCLGATIAMDLADEYRHRLRRIFLTSICQGCSVRYPRLFKSLAMFFRVLTLPFDLKKKGKLIRYPNYFTRKYLFPFVDLLNTDRKTYFSLMAELIGTPLILSDLPVNTTIVMGKRDVLSHTDRIRDISSKNPKVDYIELDTSHHVSTHAREHLIEIIRHHIEASYLNTTK